MPPPSTRPKGVTVDRVHVLATPGLDRHAAYVALSRHRERVDLHYGRDDFADDAKLARTLSRERAKDMASDYAPEQRAGAGTPKKSRGHLRLVPADRAGAREAGSRGVRARTTPRYAAGDPPLCLGHAGHRAHAGQIPAGAAGAAQGVGTRA